MPTSVPTSVRAFPSTPRVDRYFGSEPAEAARRRLKACVERGEGPALLIGAAGCGKTMLLEVLANTFAGRLRVVRLAGAQVCTRRALLQAVLHGLGEAYQGMEDGEMRIALADTLAAPGEAPAVLLVDEAQALPIRLLEELRVVAATVADGEPRALLVLAGTNTLDEAFTAPELDSFSQRIAARCYLTPLTRSESIQYVRAHVASVGGDPDALFTPDAYDALFQATDGTPRLLNQLGDRALVLAVERGEQLVTGDAIQEAWSDVHQLPAPWHTPSVTPPTETASEAEAEAEEPAAETTVDDTPAVEVAPLALAPPHPLPGVWNADRGLESVAQPADRGETTDNACVAYAFPTRPVEEAPTPTPAPVEPPAEAPAADEAASVVANDDETLAADPFAESFDDEEVVLDRYSRLEAVLRPGVARVENLREVEFGRMFEALEPAVESLIDDVASTMDAADAGGFGVVSSETEAEPSEDAVIAPAEATLEAPVDAAPPTPLEAVAHDVGAHEVGEVAGDAPADADPLDDDPPLLLLEEDEPAPTGEAVRRDYTRLFSSLRQA